MVINFARVWLEPAIDFRPRQAWHTLMNGLTPGERTDR